MSKKETKNTGNKVKKPEKKGLLGTLNNPDPAKALTIAYVLALSVIAILTVSVHAITAHITEKQKESGEIAYQIGRQRTLVQQIVLYASNHYRMGEGLDFDFMMQSLADLENGHKYILQTLQEKNASLALNRIYHKPPFIVNDQINEYSGIVKQYSQYPANTQTVEDYSKKREELINKINYKASNVLRPALDAALEHYQTETLEQMQKFYSIQLGGAIFILIVLLAEAAFIFNPLIRKIKEYNLVMKRYALEDSLTGLNNRRAFMNAATIELKRAIREESSVTVALLDLDHFKSVNDTYGHEVGDRVLQHFAGVLTQALRAGDIIGRIGGEEFAILLPRLDDKGSAHILQRLCDATANTPCRYQDPSGAEQELTYTISIGYTGPLVASEINIEQLLSIADEGLYKAKENGRNCVMRQKTPEQQSAA